MGEHTCKEALLFANNNMTFFWTDNTLLHEIIERLTKKIILCIEGKQLIGNAAIERPRYIG